MSDHYVFEHANGMTVDEHGKPQWPQHIRIVLDRRAAWELLYSLTQQLGREEQEWIQLYEYGELEKEKPE